MTNRCQYISTFTISTSLWQYVVTYDGIEGVFAWAGDVESDEDDEVDEGEFLGGKGIPSVDDEEVR